jgi:myo-inositol-1(or 4)-monophosphatase
MSENSEINSEILTQTTIAVREAAEKLRRRFSPEARPASVEALMSAVHANDETVLEQLRPRLVEIRPGAGWVEEELEGGELPPGEWWVVDPAEGNINHAHGLPEWGVTATLVRDNEPVLTTVHLPLFDATYTALVGHGAHLNGRPLRVSSKTELRLSIVGTSQSVLDPNPDTLRATSESIAAMLRDALVLRVSVPASLHLLNVAAGSMDVFWQFAGARADLLPGALLVAEAGGVITDVHGAPWTTRCTSLLAAAPSVHKEAVESLSGI